MGLRIGRTQGQIRLDHDSKVSGIHAQVDLDNKNQMVLMDQGSSNGIILNSRRVKKVALMPGVIFRIGSTDFKIIEIAEQKVIEFTPILTWKDRLKELLNETEGKNPGPSTPLQTFTPPVLLEFVQGLQAETVYTVAYGPRKAGYSHLDLQLTEPDAPELCFELIPGPGVALLKDHSLGRLSLNRKPCPQEEVPLSEGDTIGIGGTLIRVRYF